MRESPCIGARAAVRASLYCWSLTDRLSLLKIRSKVEVGAVSVELRPRSEVISLPALAASRLLVSGPPLVSVPPITRNTTEPASTALAAISVGRRW